MNVTAEVLPVVPVEPTITLTMPRDYAVTLQAVPQDDEEIQIYMASFPKASR